jgi:Ca-activated chloride channel homolog
LSLSIAAGGMTPGAGAQKPQTTFRSGVDLVSVSAVVRDRRGRPARNLQAEDFEILDHGERRGIIDFRAAEDGPVSLALLFDVSGSMHVAARLAAGRDVARHLLSTLNQETDEAALFAFDTRLRQLQDFTTDAARVDEALGQLHAFGMTSLYDAIAETASQVAERSPRRRAIVVLTDGIDTASRLTPGEVSGVASAIDVPVYVIAVVSPLDHPGGPHAVGAGARAADESLLSNLAYWTGGDLYVASVPAHASIAARQLVAELRHQYVFAFEPAAAGGWRRLEIRARKRDLEVRARSGYFAGSPRQAGSQVDQRPAAGRGRR